MVADLYRQNAKLLHDHCNKFRSTFGVSLFQFMHPLFGFDVVRFDDWLGTPDGVSQRDYIKDKYGDKALELVESLL